MKKLQLDSGYWQGIQVRNGSVHILICFTRKTEDQMNYDRYIKGSQTENGLFKAGQLIDPSDKACRLFVDGLKAKLNPDQLVGIFILQPAKQG